MNLLSWNIKKNQNIEAVISQCIITNDIDIAALIESQSIDISLILLQLGNGYYEAQGAGACEGIKILVRFGYVVTLLQEQNRYVLAEITNSQLGKSFLYAVTHLPSLPYCDEDYRKLVIRSLVSDIESNESKIGHNHTIVIGDFNACPYDEEMIQIDSFNAVLFQEIIIASETVVVNGNTFQRFYNPMLNVIKETGKSYGSFYYKHNIKPMYWYCYDQVIFRRNLIDSFINASFCRSVGPVPLLQNNKPNPDFSDHLPLIVSFQ